jgi:type IV pilus assembly protein PilB
MRKRIGEILLSAGIIDELQLRSALAEAARWGKRVGEVLISRGHCTDEQILEALASQLGVGIAPLSSTTVIPPRVLRLLPPAFARDKQALPLSLDGRTGTLEVAVADPAGYELLDELRFRTGHEIRPLVATSSELAAAIDHFYFGAPRERAAAPSAPVAARTIDLPEADPDADLFEHGIDTGEFMGSPDRSGSARAPGASSSIPLGSVPGPGASGERPPRMPGLNVAVQVRRSPTGSMESAGPAASAESLRRAAPTPAVQEAAAGAGANAGAGTGPSEIARLERRVTELQLRLDKAYAVLREAAIAHRALLAELAARGHVDRDSLARRVQEQKAAAGDGERG